ncbi:MAG: TonB family protein [Betaproteobacteria bacterium]|nr:TonB family protein [Betaproteobacteria bacterium]
MATMAPTPFRSMAPESHALLASVTVSLALHVAVLLLFPEMRLHAPGAASTRILTARLTPSAAVPEPAPAPRAAEPDPFPARVAQKRRPELSRQQPAAQSALAAPEPEAQPASEARPNLPAVAAEGVPAPAGATTASLAAPQVRDTPAPSRVSRQPPSQPAAAADAVTLDQYRLALIGVARHYKRYPVRAMENGWQGRVEVRLVIGANGSTQKTSIKISSGYEILDKEALDMIRKAKPLAPIPQSLRGREFTVDIPVIFDLQTG